MALTCARRVIRRLPRPIPLRPEPNRWVAGSLGCRGSGAEASRAPGGRAGPSPQPVPKVHHPMRAGRPVTRLQTEEGMAQFDLTLPELEVYDPPRSEPADFDAFWASTIAASRELAAPPRFEPIA